MPESEELLETLSLKVLEKTKTTDQTVKDR
jgi:hypothetical protein